MHIRKKTFVLLMTYLIAAVVALSAYCLAQSTLGRNYRYTAEYGYEHAFGEVVRAADNLSRALHRGAYTTGAEMSAEVCADIYGNCLAAEMTMSALPFSTQELENTSGFIGIAGDYAQSLMRSCAADGFGDAERKNMAALYKTAKNIADSLEELSTDIDDGAVMMDAPENVYAANGGKTVSSAMLKLEEGMEKAPELDYDGKYTVEECAACEDPISEEEALSAAAEFFGFDEAELETEYRTENGCTCLDFEGGNIIVDGEGNVLSMSSSRTVAGDMESSDLEKIARRFLEDKDFGELHLVSSERTDSVLNMKFEFVDNGVRCEKDSVKIGIAADNGTVYYYDATEHVNNHCVHEAAEPGLSEAEASAGLPHELALRDAVLTYAKTSGGNERLCYDFTCVGNNGEKVHIFIDADSGEQFRIEI